MYHRGSSLGPFSPRLCRGKKVILHRVFPLFSEFSGPVNLPFEFMSRKVSSAGNRDASRTLRYRVSVRSTPQTETKSTSVIRRPFPPVRCQNSASRTEADLIQAVPFRTRLREISRRPAKDFASRTSFDRVSSNAVASLCPDRLRRPIPDAMTIMLDSPIVLIRSMRGGSDRSAPAKRRPVVRPAKVSRDKSLGRRLTS